MAILAGISDRKSEVFMKEPLDAAAVRVFPPAVPLLTILLGVALKRLCPSKLKLNLSCLSRYGIGGAIVGVAVGIDEAIEWLEVRGLLKGRAS